MLSDKETEGIERLRTLPPTYGAGKRRHYEEDEEDEDPPRLSKRAVGSSSVRIAIYPAYMRSK